VLVDGHPADEAHGGYDDVGERTNGTAEEARPGLGMGIARCRRIGVILHAPLRHAAPSPSPSRPRVSTPPRVC
jgi:hypothetical protein